MVSDVAGLGFLVSAYDGRRGLVSEWLDEARDLARYGHESRAVDARMCEIERSLRAIGAYSEAGSVRALRRGFDGPHEAREL